MKWFLPVLVLAGAVLVWGLSSSADTGLNDAQVSSQPAIEDEAATEGGVPVLPLTEPTRIAAPSSSNPTPVAHSPSSPWLTLGGHLESHFQSIANGKRWKGDPSEVKRSPGASQLAASKQWNPAGKQLSIEQERQLQAMVDAFDERWRPIQASERKATIEALARAAAAGTFESIELDPPRGMDPIAQNRHTEGAYRKMKELQGALGRFGRDGIDYAWATAPSVEPDGIPRQNLVYFLRAVEADVFRLRDEARSIMLERQRAYTEFFQRLP